MQQFQYSVGEPDKFYEYVGKIVRKHSNFLKIRKFFISKIKRDWDGKEFFLRWFRQSNYPSVSIRVTQLTNKTNQIHILQDRFTNSEDSIFGLDLLYPSPYKYFFNSLL